MAYRGRVKDVVIMLPGITGSILQKDGKDMWALSGRAIWSLLRSGADFWRDMSIPQEDHTLDDLGDGIKATGVIQDSHIVPGLVKVDGYTDLRHLFENRFRMVVGSIENQVPANYFDFPYDWRRDNRASARHLKQFVDERLPIWRTYSGAEEAQVILVAHSMGGLVSRYYLEVLGGWEQCRALITFGTPYRGSLNSIETLAYGYKNKLPAFTEMARSFDSVHQLLPVYQSVLVDGVYYSLTEVDGIPGIDRQRVIAAKGFHEEIQKAVESHESLVAYQENGYELVPIVGTKQSTMQSAEFREGKVVLTETPPDAAWEGEGIVDGDGTVPRVSAIPLEQSGTFNGRFIAEKHSCLQVNETVLAQVFELIKWTQASDRGDVRGIAWDTYSPNEAALNLMVDDMYFPDEVVVIGATVVNMSDPGVVTAVVTPLIEDGEVTSHPLMEKDGKWSVVLEDLAPGTYRVVVNSERAGIDAVRDVFEVVGE